MRKNIMIFNKLVAALACMPLLAQAQMVPAIDHTAAISPAEFVPANPQIELNDKERRALQLVREWKKNPQKPQRSADGSVVYVFGATLPTLICTPLQVCTVRLQPGEVANDVTIGDQARWEVTRATIGSGPSAIETAVVKARDTGLTTSLLVTTDRRSYTIQLKSARHEWMPSISFVYPDDMARVWESHKAAQAKRVYATTLPTGERIDSLDFGFRVSGDSPKWKPRRVYTDGTKTYIQFPSSRFADEAPALVALEGGGLFSDPKEQIVNYRLIGDRFVVDGLPERMALISGVGSDQVRVIIERGEEK